MFSKYIGQIGALTCPGNKNKNEDRIFVQRTLHLQEKALQEQKYAGRRSAARTCFAVADGISMGGGGEVAAQEAVASCKTMLRSRRSYSRMSIEKILQTTNESVAKQLQKQGFSIGGTTLSLLCIQEQSYMTANVGDSPIYLYRDGSLTQLSMPHTLAEFKRQQGILSVSIADENTLYQYIGNPMDPVEAHFSEGTVLPGDTFLLCSDGLTKILSDAEIADCLVKNMDAEEIVRLRLDRADDNVSLILIRIEERHRRIWRAKTSSLLCDEEGDE